MENNYEYSSIYEQNFINDLHPDFEMNDSSENGSVSDNNESTEDSELSDSDQSQSKFNFIPEAELPEENDVSGFMNNFKEYMISSFSNLFTTEESHDDEVEEDLANMFILLYHVFRGTLAIVALFIIGSKYYKYIEILHENHLWFSNLKEIEREISFRTEQGFYYSFYKQLIQADSFSRGLESLRSDNRTEYGHTIDATQRFNLLPEITLSYIYRFLELQISPILFYVKCVFVLHGIFIGILYLTSWYLSGSILSGILTSIMVVIHRVDLTRVNYTVPLRESFAIPILYLQIFLMGNILKTKKYKVIKHIMNILLMAELLMTWQFIPYILFCQLVLLIFLCRTSFITSLQTLILITSMAIAILISAVVQNYPPFLISSVLTSSIVPAIILSISPQISCKSSILKLIAVLLECILLCLLTIVINLNIKDLIGEDSDSHVYNLLLSKLGLSSQEDFDVRLYKCSEAFNYMDLETIMRLAESGLLGGYLISAIWIGKYFIEELGYKASGKKSHYLEQNYIPLIFFMGLSIIFGGLSLLILRLKALWLPTVCVLFGVILTSDYFYETILHHFDIESTPLKIVVTKIVTVLVVCSLLVFQFWEKVSDDIWPDELYEFYDPDTVHLMEWIKDHTSPTAVFAGSMQLMAAVKLSTNRSITNHPHYEDSWIRHRTRQVYEIYGRKESEEIHEILSSIYATHIIIEESICNAKPNSSQKFCNIVDIVDISNGHISIDEQINMGHSKNSNSLRFCLHESMLIEKNRKLFSLVMSNETFRVYEVMR